MPEKGRLGSGAFCTTVVVFSVLTVRVYSESGLFCTGAAAGDRDLFKELRLAGVGVMVVVAVASLPAGLSTVSTLREVGGEVALLVAGAAAGGSSSFGESSGDREEEYGVSTV